MMLTMDGTEIISNVFKEKQLANWNLSKQKEVQKNRRPENRVNERRRSWKRNERGDDRNL